LHFPRVLESARTFLIVEHNPEGTALIVRTLLRRYPFARTLECTETQQALEYLRSVQADAVIVHRPIGMSGVDAIRAIRKVARKVPIVMMSSVDRQAEAMAAGADSFLLYDAWLMLGGVVQDLLGSRV
jgi:CheY-like chemotaxis protein